MSLNGGKCLIFQHYLATIAVSQVVNRRKIAINSNTLVRENMSGTPVMNRKRRLHKETQTTLFDRYLLLKLEPSFVKCCPVRFPIIAPMDN